MRENDLLDIVSFGSRDLRRWSDGLSDVFHRACWSDGGVSDLVNEPGSAVRLRLAEEKNVWLCTVRPDGSAHVTPVWFVYQSSRWWIGSDYSSVKVRNVLKEPRVSLALEDGRFPVVAEGDASLIRGGFPHEVVTAFEQKYGWGRIRSRTTRKHACASGGACA
ncbi:pyridoxamine 5'-phosphate oxidase family protein [Streptomyces sparsogenes]